MALVAIDAVVDITRHLVVLEIVGVISSMTAGALEDGVVVRVDVARRADIPGSAVAGGELRVLRVIEGGAGPGCGVVATLAGRGEKLRLRGVAGIGGVVVVGLMATDAGRRQRRVIVVHMAIGTLPRRYGMRPSEGKGCVVVIEGRVGPDGRIVAKFALRGKSRCSMRRTSGTRVVVLMA